MDQCESQAAARPIQNMRITFWGVQGSCAIFPSPNGMQEYTRRLLTYALERTFADIQAAGGVAELLGGAAAPPSIERYHRRIGLPDLPFYGGETTCVEVETSEGNIILFDAGSGIRRCSLSVVRRCEGRTDRKLHLFGTHEHLDHRSGWSFARFFYVEPAFTVHVYGPHQFLHALDDHYGLFSQRIGQSTYIDDPVDYTMMAAKFHATELRPEFYTPARPVGWEVRGLAEPIHIGGTTVQPFELYHATTVCLGYRVEHGGKSFVFCTDHELRHAETGGARQQRSIEAEHRLRERCRDADVAYFDAQYYLDEYLGKKGIGNLPAFPRVDWGHSCIEDGIERADRCRIGRTYLGHHDPERPWAERLEIDQALMARSKNSPHGIRLADGEMTVDV